MNNLLATKINTYRPGVLRYILVLDNALIHAGFELELLCATYGVKLKFLPPYSLDLNLIKQTFYKIKT